MLRKITTTKQLSLIGHHSMIWRCLHRYNLLIPAPSCSRYPMSWPWEESWRLANERRPIRCQKHLTEPFLEFFLCLFLTDYIKTAISLEPYLNTLSSICLYNIISGNATGINVYIFVLMCETESETADGVEWNITTFCDNST